MQIFNHEHMKASFLLIILVLLTISCSTQGIRSNSIFNHVQQLLPEEPDSARRYIEKNRHKLISPKQIAWAILMEHYINNLKDYEYYEDSITIKIMQNSHYYTTEYTQALSFYYKGVFLFHKSEYEKAIELFHAAEQTANKLEWYHLLGMIYNKSSEVFFKLELYNTSIEYADKSASQFMLSGDERLATRALATKIFSLYELKECEEAQQLYRLTKKKSLKSDDRKFLTYLNSEIISILLFYGDNNSAQSYYADIKNLRNDTPPTSIESLYCASFYLNRRQPDSAFYYLSHIQDTDLYDYDRISLQSLFSDYYRQKGEYRTALGCMLHNQTLRDSLIHSRQRISLIKVESRSQNLKMRLLYEKKVALRDRIVYWGSVIFFALIVFLFVYLYKARKQKSEMSNRLALVSEMVSDLKESNQTLLSKLDVHKEKENLLKEHIESKLAYAKLFADLYYKFPDKPGTILKKMNEMIDLVPMNKEFTAGIINNVNLYYNNAIEKLLHTHPYLTQAEILFSSLIIAGFCMQEMSLILNCNSVDAVYTRKYRLKQKLSLSKNIDIEDYLAAFALE